jgi:glycosyltransferase involved in cell wall biosynthesis
VKIGFLLGRPTQFEGPFFRHASAAGGADLTVLYLSAGDPAGTYDPELGRKVAWGIDLLSGYSHKLVPSNARFRWLAHELRRERYDWLIINGYTTWPYLAALAIARVRGIKTGLRIDSVLFNASGWRRQAMKRGVIGGLSSLYDRFFATGSLAREYLLRFGVEPARMALFPYTVDTKFFSAEAARGRAERVAFRQRLGIPGDAQVVLAVAKFNQREAPWDLLRALEGLDLWTVVVGDGELDRALRAHATAHGLRQLVFPGYVPYAELPSYYAMADVFVHAATNEPWGVSVHEAIACGLPVVASSRVGAAYDLVRPGRNGYIYESGDAAALRARLSATIHELGAAQVREANGEVLARWNYDATWSGLLEAVGA